MKLQLAIILSCRDGICRLHVLADNALVDAVLAEPMRAHGIAVEAGQVAVVDRTGAPQVVFRLAPSAVERMEAGSAILRGPCGLADAVPVVDWLQGEVAASDVVLLAFGEVCDIAHDGQPAHPDRLRVALFPRIEALYQRMEATKGLEPRRAVEEGYDRIAERYSEWVQAAHSPERERYTNTLLERLPSGAGVLDLGCGAGLPTTLALAQRFRVTGVDISRRQIELAQRNVPGASFARADVTQLDLPPASLDGGCRPAYHGAHPA